MHEVTYTVRPAYGRVYMTKEQALQDWKDGRDFKIVNGPYCSCRDFCVDQNTLILYGKYLQNVVVAAGMKTTKEQLIDQMLGGE
jgi:hypothetical protein